jgi:hypothetical protein
MYYEEKLINGIWHWRGSQTEEFKRMDEDRLRGKIDRMQQQLDEAQAWKDAVIDHMCITHVSIGSNPREHLDAVINWYCEVDCDPRVSNSFAAKKIEALQSQLTEANRRGEELVALLKSAKCPNSGCDNNGTIAQQVAYDEWEPEQCQWCDEKATATSKGE